LSPYSKVAGITGLPQISLRFLAREDWDFLERFLDMSTVVHILQNASLASRQAFHALFQSLKDSDSGGEALYQ